MTSADSSRRPVPKGFGYSLLARDGLARRGRLTTAHGVVETPAFMAVGTAATVKGLTVEQIRSTGTEIVLGNTYHLMLRPGAEVVEKLGGLHRFMRWAGPILTDSGGYQVMSLAELRKLTEEGVTFRSHIDGSAWDLTPEKAVAIQEQLGADIAMVLDECTPYPANETVAGDSMRRSMRWAARSKNAFRPRPGHALFGIVQGGIHPGLRQESVSALVDIGFDGYAIGGLAVGEGQELMFQTLDATLPAMPEDRPRYLMGVGKPADLVGAVQRGVDMFDCVLPTRSGRTGQAFTWSGVVNLRNARHREDPRPLDTESPCAVSRDYSRAYLHHLFRSDEMLGPILLTIHNLAFYQELMAGLREAIEAGQLADYAADFARRQAQGDIPSL